MSMICCTTGSPAFLIQVTQPIRSMSTGSAASWSAAVMSAPSRSPRTSKTARNSASLPGKWWYSEPRLTPDSARTASIDVPS